MKHMILTCMILALLQGISSAENRSNIGYIVSNCSVPVGNRNSADLYEPFMQSLHDVVDSVLNGRYPVWQETGSGLNKRFSTAFRNHLRSNESPI
ncbi:MAG: hypothetical protein ACOC41_05655 [Chitinivibrionales bacterium]